MPGVQDRVIVVTGAGGGLGREYALTLAKEGASVVVNDLGGARDGTGAGHNMADEVVNEIKAAGGDAMSGMVEIGSTGQAAPGPLNMKEYGSATWQAKRQAS